MITPADCWYVLLSSRGLWCEFCLWSQQVDIAGGKDDKRWSRQVPVMSNPLPGCVRVRFIKSYYVSFGVTSIGWINRKYSSKRTIKSKCDTSWLSCEVYMYLLSLCTICKLSLSHRFKFRYLSPQLSWNWKVSSDTDS